MVNEYEYKGTKYSKKAKDTLEAIQTREITLKQIKQNIADVETSKTNLEEGLKQANEVLAFWQELYKLANE